MMNLYGLEVGRAGHFLQEYENKRYTLFEKWTPFQRSIIVPATAEVFADESFWDKGMNWAEYKNHARATIIRLGQGQWKDSEFESFYASCKEQGIAVGGYWFYDGRTSPSAQAKMIVEMMEGKTFELELFIDWEHNYGGQYEGVANVVALMKILEAYHLNVHDIGMYTGYYWFTENNNKSYDSYLATKPLWLAWYASPAVVKVPSPWKTWTHWQSGTPTVQWGQPTAELDMDTYNGTTVAFETTYLSHMEPPTHPGHLIELLVDKVPVFSQVL